MDKSSTQHEIKYFFIEQYSAVSNNFFNLPYSITKTALPRYSRVSYQKLNGWEFGHWLTANFTFPRCDVEKYWPFSMPLWCNQHLPGQSASIIIAFVFLVCLSLRVPKAFFGGEGKLCFFSKYSNIPFFDLQVIFCGQMISINQQHYVLNSL